MIILTFTDILYNEQLAMSNGRRQKKCLYPKTAKGEVSVLPKYVGETDYEPPHGIFACF